MLNFIMTDIHAIINKKKDTRAKVCEFIGHPSLTIALLSHTVFEIAVCYFPDISTQNDYFHSK